MDPGLPSNSFYLINLDEISKFDDSTEQKKRKRATDEQLDKVVSFMANYPDFTKGSSKSDDDQTLAWENLTIELNAMGPPQHSSKEWRTVWSRFKGNKKRKLTAESDTVSGSSFDNTTLEPVQSGHSATYTISSTDAIPLSDTIPSADTIPSEDQTKSHAIELLSKIVENTANILVALKDLKDVLVAKSVSST